MKCTILHEGKGRMRVHVENVRMTLHRADVLEAYLNHKDAIVHAAVYERTGDVVITYTGKRTAAIAILAGYKFDVAELFVFTEQHRFAVLQIDRILCASFLRCNRSVSSVIKDYTVLQNFHNRCTLMVGCCFQNLYRSGAVYSDTTCKETSACTECQFCRMERVFYRSVRR